METAWSGALVKRGNCTGLIHGFEVRTKKSECDDLDTEDNGVESKGGLKRGRRRRAGAGDVGPRIRVRNE